MILLPRSRDRMDEENPPRADEGWFYPDGTLYPDVALNRKRILDDLSPEEAAISAERIFFGPGAENFRTPPLDRETCRRMRRAIRSELAALDLPFEIPLEEEPEPVLETRLPSTPSEWVDALRWAVRQAPLLTALLWSLAGIAGAVVGYKITEPPSAGPQIQACVPAIPPALAQQTPRR